MIKGLVSKDEFGLVLCRLVSGLSRADTANQVSTSRFA
jgi:hypothetical protein